MDIFEDLLSYFPFHKELAACWKEDCLCLFLLAVEDRYLFGVDSRRTDLRQLFVGELYFSIYLGLKIHFLRLDQDFSNGN